MWQRTTGGGLVGRALWDELAAEGALEDGAASEAERRCARSSAERSASIADSCSSTCATRSREESAGPGGIVCLLPLSLR